MIATIAEGSSGDEREKERREESIRENTGKKSVEHSTAFLSLEPEKSASSNFSLQD
jgi:hypothetical protein